MDNVKTDAYYMQKICHDLQFIVKYMKNVDIEELQKNEILLDSMMFRMIQLSENVKNYLKNIKGKDQRFPGMPSMDCETESYMIMEMLI